MKICGLCLLILLLSSLRADAQPTPIPTSNRDFSIPFQVRPDASADPAKEIELLVSRDRGARWHSVGRKPLDGKQFDFKAEEDGEYWFAFRTITLSGNIRQTGTGPQIRVLVDATAPVLTLEMKQQESGQMMVRWKAVENNLQGKRPDFAVAVPSFDQEKQWKSLNIDTRHQKASETEIEGGFLFWPENGISEIELRAILSDAVGNRAEKTVSAKIKPVNRDVEEILQDSMKTHEPAIESPDARVSPANLAEMQNAATGPFDGPSIPVPQGFYGPTTPSGTPLTPPKPIRISTKNKRQQLQSSKPTISEEPLLAKEYRPAPSLEGPEDETLEVPEPVKKSVKKETSKPKTPKTASKPDELSRQILADMDRFFGGQLGSELKETETVEKKKRTTELVGGPALSPSDPLPIPAALAPAPATPNRALAENRAAPPTPKPSQPEPPQPEPPAPFVLPGSITGISMSTTDGQARIIVKWNSGDANWDAAQVDVLRGPTPQGPWMPIATNLPNNGQYWWFLTKDDLTPFHVLLRIRSLHGIRNDATPSPITIDPKMLAP